MRFTPAQIGPLPSASGRDDSAPREGVAALRAPDAAVDDAEGLANYRISMLSAASYFFVPDASPIERRSVFIYATPQIMYFGRISCAFMERDHFKI